MFKKEKRTLQISYLGPKQHQLSFGPNVVHLQLFAVLSKVGVGMDMESEGGSVVKGGGCHCHWLMLNVDVL